MACSSPWCPPLGCCTLLTLFLALQLLPLVLVLSRESPRQGIPLARIKCMRACVRACATLDGLALRGGVNRLLSLSLSIYTYIYIYIYINMYMYISISLSIHYIYICIYTYIHIHISEPPCAVPARLGGERMLGKRSRNRGVRAAKTPATPSIYTYMYRERERERERERDIVIYIYICICMHTHVCMQCVYIYIYICILFISCPP